MTQQAVLSSQDGSGSIDAEAGFGISFSLRQGQSSVVLFCVPLLYPWSGDSLKAITLLLPCGFFGSNPGCLACWQVLIPTEQSHWPLVLLITLVTIIIIKGLKD